jgi:uncharacterized protein YcbK (DUF882 family)
MSLVKINKTDDFKVSENFNISEYYTDHKKNPKIQELDSDLFQAVQFLRNLFGGIRITSAFRSKEYQKEIQMYNPFAVNESPHSKGIAVDFVLNEDEYNEKLKEFHKDIEDRGSIYQGLRKLGINGIGLYDHFIHLDTRKYKTFNNFNNEDSFGKYSVWDSRQKKT